MDHYPGLLSTLGGAGNKRRVWLAALRSARARVNGGLKVQRQRGWSYLHAKR